MNTYTDEAGVEYAAFTAEPLTSCPDIGSCTGCAFELGHKECVKSQEAPGCMGYLRADKRYIIWVKKESD